MNKEVPSFPDTEIDVVEKFKVLDTEVGDLVNEQNEPASKEAASL